MPDPFELRSVLIEDAGEMAETMRLGFESYQEWTEPGWKPMPVDFEARQIAERLGKDDVWGRIALVDGAHAGHVTVAPARERDEERTPIPGLAHLWHLFVRPPWWGGGLAPRLLGLAVAAAAERDYPAMRLFTPVGNARGRAFYEREGFRLVGQSHFEPLLALEIVQYRRDLPASNR